MEIDNTYKSEIQSKIIFMQMKNCYYNFFHKNKFLNINIIVKDYFHLRSSLIELLKKIAKLLGFKSQTFFLSVYYLDIIIIEASQILGINNYSSLALACLVVASKYCENDPNVPQLPYFIRVYNNIFGYKEPIAISELIYNEVKICKILNYKLQYYTIYDYNYFFFSHGILKLEQLKEIKKDNDIPFSIHAKTILEKIYKKSRSYLDVIINKRVCFKYSSLLISIYIMQKSVESIIINESKIINDIEKIQIRRKTQQYFKEIMNDFYKINYENNKEYILLKKEIEPYKDRNKNIIPSIINKLSFSNNAFKSNLSTTKINKNINKSKLENHIQKYSNYLKKNNNHFYEKNHRNLTENNQRDSTSMENKLLSQSILNNIKNGKLIIQTSQSNDFKYSPNNYLSNNNIINKNLDIINNYKKEIKNYNYGVKRSFNSIKYLNNISYNISDEKKSIYFNNFANKVPSSANLNINKLSYLNQSIDYLKTKPNSPENKEKLSSEVIIYINKKSKINKYINSKINKTEGNINCSKNLLDFCNKAPSNLKLMNDRDKTNESQLMNINKLYYRKILYNNNENKFKSHSNKKEFKVKINKSTNSIKHLIINNNPYNEILKLNKKIGNLYKNKNNNSEESYFNNRYGNIFLSDNDIDNDIEDDIKNKNTKIEVNSFNNYISGKSYVNKKINLKERNSIGSNKLKLLSNTVNQPPKAYDDNDLGNNYLNEFFEKKKFNSKKKKKNINLYNNNFIFKSQDEKYINTDVNVSYNSTSINPNNIIRAKSKEIGKNEKIINLKSKKLLIKQKYSSKKINLNKNPKNFEEKKTENQENNAITFLGNNDINNIYFSNINIENKKKKFTKINCPKLNKNKLIMNNNIIKNNLNKFDNEIFSLNNRNIKKNCVLNLNTTESLDIIVRKNNFKKLKELNSEKNKNKKKFEIKNYTTSSSNNHKNVNKKIKKNIFSTIIIDNNIKINLKKKKKSKENNKLNFKLNLDNNIYKNFYKNNEIKVLKKSDLFNRTTDINNKNTKNLK